MTLRSSHYKDEKKFRATRKRQRNRYYNKTAIYPRRTWTLHEMDIILEHKFTDMEISKMLKRSVKSIQVKRSKLKAKATH